MYNQYLNKNVLKFPQTRRGYLINFDMKSCSLNGTFRNSITGRSSWKSELRVPPTYLQSKLTFIPDHYGKKASMKSFPSGQSIQRKGESSAIHSNRRLSKLICPQPRRRLWRVQIREYLIAAVQNLQVLLKYGAPLTRGLAFKLIR